MRKNAARGNQPNGGTREGRSIAVPSKSGVGHNRTSAGTKKNQKFAVSNKFDDMRRYKNQSRLMGTV